MKGKRYDHRSNLVKDLFEEDADYCERTHSPFDVCEDCVYSLGLNDPRFADHETEHPRYDEGMAHYCVMCVGVIDEE